jgi:hypothetical protein
MLPPRVELPPRLATELDTARAGLAAEMTGRLEALRRPCVYLGSQRTGDAPLRRSSIATWLGMKTAEPKLSVLASKFGGTPYSEGDEDWDPRWLFIGQIDLGEATAAFRGQHPFRSVAEVTGLLRVDIHEPPPAVPMAQAFRVRHFREPALAKAVPVRPRSLGTHEAAIVFEPGWSIPEGERWDALLPRELSAELEETWSDGWLGFPAGFGDDHEGEHRLFGWRAAGLDDPCWDAYETLLSLTFDTEAGFSWGSSSYHLLVPTEDLARGDFDGVVVTCL